MVTVAVTGACGQIAYHLIFSLLKGEVFGDEKITLHLIDIKDVQTKLQSVVMEIEDCAFSRLEKVKIFDSDNLQEGFKDIDFAFLVGASPRLEGMERSDLLAKNGEIFKAQGKALSNYAKPSCKVLVVGNPCNTNCLVAMHHAKNIPNEQFFAMMMLDEHRARTQIANHVNKPLSDIQVYVYGNHSATQYPDYENANVEPDDWYLDTLLPMVQQRGAEVIKMRGASSAASAAHAAITTAYHLVNPTDQLFSVASVLGGYNSPKGLIVSMPHTHSKEGIKVHEGFEHSESAKALIQKSYEELMQEHEQVKSMGLLDD